MIFSLLRQLERNPHAVFYETELRERFPGEFVTAKTERLIKRVPIGGSYGRGLSRPRALIDGGDGTFEAYDDEDPEVDPIKLTTADLIRWQLDLDQVGRRFQERNGLSGETGALTSRFHYLGEAAGTAYVLGLLHERKAARESLAGLPELLPRKLQRTVVACPTYTPPPERAWAPADILVMPLGQSDLYLLPVGEADMSRESGEFVFRRGGDGWLVRFEGREFSMRHLRGLEHIARLLAHPGQEVSALELSGGGHVSKAKMQALSQESLRVADSGNVGQPLDAQAQKEYRARIGILKEKLGAGSLSRSEIKEMTDEQVLLERELGRAFGLRGRPRLVGDSAEKARTNVRQALSRAITAIQEHDFALAQFLRNCIKTGYTCSYSPDRPVHWAT